jgi:methionyl-tRNA formyltransferase
MRVERELDAGPMFAMRAVAIPPDATSGDMESVLAPLGAELLMPVVDALADGRAVETPQDHASATLAPKITKEEGVIDWTQPASMVHNRVRGLQPWPLASTTLAGARYVLRRTGARPPADPGARSADRHRGQASDERSADLTPEAGALGRSADLTPGTVVRAQGDELVVACGGGTAIAILEIQPEGRRTMTAREFLAGRGALAGARFGS